MRSLTEQIDITTLNGGMIFQIFGALGQFERDLIRERTRAGLSAAAARGRKFVVTPEILCKAQVLIGQGLKVREVATHLKLSKSALYEALAGYEANIDREPRCNTQEHSSGAGQ